LASSEIYSVSDAGRLWQGEIVSDIVEYRILAPDGVSDDLNVEPVTHPVAIVLSQDCDLEWDYRARRADAEDAKQIPNVLFCEVIDAETFRGRRDIKSDIWRRIKNNSDERYAFLESIPVDQDALGMGLPDLGVDFKRYFALPTPEVYSQIESGTASKRSRLRSPYLEHFCSRFFRFQARVALPREHGQAQTP
jgi:hypothetical protein